MISTIAHLISTQKTFVYSIVSTKRLEKDVKYIQSYLAKTTE